MELLRPYLGMRSECCLDLDSGERVTKLNEASKSPLGKGWSCNSSWNDSSASALDTETEQAIKRTRRMQVIAFILVLLDFKVSPSVFCKHCKPSFEADETPHHFSKENPERLFERRLEETGLLIGFRSWSVSSACVY